MAQGNPYARFVEVMKRQGRAMNEPAMTVGIVTGVDPVSISVDGVPIAEHIYCNQVTSSNKDEELAAILEQEEYVSRMKRLVGYKLDSTAMIVENDFYGYVFGE